MTIGTIECFAGISGDMLLGALIDAGVPMELLQRAASALGIGAELRIHSVDRGGIRATKVDVLENGVLAEKNSDPHAHGVDEEGDHHHRGGPAHVHGRHWPEIRELIAAAALPEGGKAIALRAFELLAAAEGKIHGIAPEKVHFHEVGAVDAIADIVCGAVGLDSLRVDRWLCSAVNVGSGVVTCAHGTLAVPAPATAELLRGIPLYAAGPPMEMTTPTGAAMLRALDCEFNANVPVEIDRIGYGAGGRNPEGFANVLRLSLGTAFPARERGYSADRVVMLECAIDDTTPQILAHAMELALEHGALDVMTAPVAMKKGRQGTLITVLCRREKEEDLERLLFRETTTLGIRRHEEERVVLDREFITVDTTYGKIRMKVASAGTAILQATPEYEDCRRAAREHDVALRTVMEAARAAYSAADTEKTKA